MKFFQMILVIASLALLCTGCPSDPIGSQDSSNVQVDGGSNDGGSTDSDVKSQNDGSADVEIQWNKYTNLTVHIQTPDGLPADIYICGVHSCYAGEVTPDVDPPNSYTKKFEGVKEADYSMSSFGFIEFKVYAFRKNYLFTYIDVHYVVGNKKEDTMNVTWTGVGSWGLAPNGTYTSLKDGKKKNITTSVKNGEVTLISGLSDLARITGDQLIESKSMSALGLKISGIIQSDLQKINIHLIDGADSQDDTLTKQ